MFEPLRTPRLIVRPLRADDVDAVHAWRNDPEVARLQAWALPFARERVEEIVSSAIEAGGPVLGRWWTAAIEHADSGQILGEVVVKLANQSRTAEVGYNLARQAWGQGYATEALGAVLSWLFDTFPLTRAWGGLHPDNRASAMVLERNGFLFEGHTRLSFWVADDNSDDWIYGMTRADWETWRSRPRHPPENVRLVPITADNAAAVRALRTHRSQQAFVAPVLDSFADALVPEVVDGVSLVPWMRAVEADGALVGFVMLALPDPVHRSPYLWRLLIDRLHQRRGIASRVLDLLIDECRRLGARELMVSWVEGKGSPAAFYLARGFVPTGDKPDGETEARLDLANA